MALKLKNDVWGVLYKVKKDSIFSFLSQEKINELENIKSLDYSNIYNETLAVTIDSFLYVDQSCQDMYFNEVSVLPKGSEEREEKQKEYASCLDENVNHFVAYIINNGYPNYLTTRVDPIVILYHINSPEVWKQVEPTLQKALKNGLIRPYDYAYIYFRSNKLDERYNPHSFPEMSWGKNLSKQQAFNIEAGNIGVGI